MRGDAQNAESKVQERDHNDTAMAGRKIAMRHGPDRLVRGKRHGGKKHHGRKGKGRK